MKKIICLVLLVVVIAFLVSEFGDRKPEVVFDGTPDEIFELPDFDFDAGVVSGEGNERTISFKPVEVLPGLTAERVVKFKESGNVEWTVLLESTDFEGEYTHIENIPKSFAKDVGDIEFSREPDIIINPDPSVAWITHLVTDMKERLEAKIKMDYEFDGTAAASVSFIESLDDIRLFAGLEKCRLEKFDKRRLYCMIDLIGKYPDKFHVDHCAGLSDMKNGFVEQQACRAYLTQNIHQCRPALFDYRNVVWENYKDINEVEKEMMEKCKEYAFLAGHSACHKIVDEDKRDLCIIEQVVWAEYAGGCEIISSTLHRQRCFAQINQDDKACFELMKYGDILSEDDYISCCNLLEEEAYRSRCIEYVSDEEDSEEGAFMGEFDCPIPAGAKHRVSSKEDWWSMDDNFYTSVGLTQTWFDKEKSKRMFVICYNAKGERHGVNKRWNKDGMLEYDYNYKNNKFDGICREWIGSDLIFECIYEDGECISCLVGHDC